MRSFSLIFFLIFSFSSFAQERFKNDIFEIAKVETQTYAIKDGEVLKLDIYRPQKDTSRLRPLIVFMHGGGFGGGSRSSDGEVKFAENAAKKGYVAVQISYRLTRKNATFGCDFEAEGKIQTFRAAAEDFMDAVDFLLRHHKKYRIDPSKIIVGGSSAGAEAVLNAVYNAPLMFERPQKYRDIEFAGVFSLAGAILDARYITREKAVPGVFFHGTNDNLVPYATAAHHLCDPAAPGYLMLDGPATITNKLRQFDSSFLLFTFKGGKHEHAGMPVNYFPEVFDFFAEVFLNGKKKQIEVIN